MPNWQCNAKRPFPLRMSSVKILFKDKNLSTTRCQVIVSVIITPCIADLPCLLFYVILSSYAIYLPQDNFAQLNSRYMSYTLS